MPTQIQGHVDNTQTGAEEPPPIITIIITETQMYRTKQCLESS